MNSCHVSRDTHRLDPGAFSTESFARLRRETTAPQWVPICLHTYLFLRFLLHTCRVWSLPLFSPFTHMLHDVLSSLKPWLQVRSPYRALRVPSAPLSSRVGSRLNVGLISRHDTIRTTRSNVRLSIDRHTRFASLINRDFVVTVYVLESAPRCSIFLLLSRVEGKGKCA